MPMIALLKLLAQFMTRFSQKMKIKVKPEKYNNPWFIKEN